MQDISRRPVWWPFARYSATVDLCACRSLSPINPFPFPDSTWLLHLLQAPPVLRVSSPSREELFEKVHKVKLLVGEAGGTGEQITLIALSVVVQSEPTIPPLVMEHIFC